MQERKEATSFTARRRRSPAFKRFSRDEEKTFFKYPYTPEEEASAEPKYSYPNEDETFSEQGSSSDKLSDEALPSDTDSDAPFRPQSEFERWLVAETPPLQQECMPLYSLMLVRMLFLVNRVYVYWIVILH